jgi:hypothetical protein
MHQQQQEENERERNGDRHLEKHGTRRAAEDAARPAAEGAERAAAADRLAAEATRAAARKQVEAISPRGPGTENGEGRGQRWSMRIDELGFGVRGGAMRRRRRHGWQGSEWGFAFLGEGEWECWAVEPTIITGKPYR